jgi:hypothetical protein
MKMKYYRYTLEGTHAADEALQALGDAAAQGMLVRLDTGGEQTHVYIASVAPAKAMKENIRPGIKVKEVPASAVTKIS